MEQARACSKMHSPSYFTERQRHLPMAGAKIRQCSDCLKKRGGNLQKMSGHVLSLLNNYSLLSHSLPPLLPPCFKFYLFLPASKIVVCKDVSHSSAGEAGKEHSGFTKLEASWKLWNHERRAFLSSLGSSRIYLILLTKIARGDVCPQCLVLKPFRSVLFNLKYLRFKHSRYIIFNLKAGCWKKPHFIFSQISVPKIIVLLIDHGSHS